MFEYNKLFLYSIWTPPFNLLPFSFKSLTNCKDFPSFLNGELGCASHLVYKFDKQIAMCNNSQMKIHISCLDIKNETANDVLAEQNISKG